MGGSVALAAAGCVGTPECPPAPQAEPVELRVLSYNVGNGDDDDPHYQLRLARQDYEDHVGARIRALQAEIVALQEVLPPATCASFVERDPALTCFDAARRPPQVRRLLGANYDFACDGRVDLECVAVRRDFGRIVGPAIHAPLPLRTCRYEGCDEEAPTCDAEATVSAVDLATRLGPLRVVHVHASAVGVRCRQLQAAQAFELAGDGPALLVGDWNFDPDLGRHLLEAAIWSHHVGPGRRFADLHVRDAQCRALRTSVGHPVAIDRAVADTFTGTCRPLADPRLDDGFPATMEREARIDHYALLCELRRIAR